MGVLNVQRCNKFASMAKRAFDKPEYKSLLNGTTVSNVSTEVSKSVSMQSVLDKIIITPSGKKNETSLIFLSD